MAEPEIWYCKIGAAVPLMNTADGPMRDAVVRAYAEVTGAEPTFTFSGWGAELSESERAVVEDRLPTPQPPADTDTLVERLHNLLVKELDGKSVDDLSRLADALAREREARYAEQRDRNLWAAANSRERQRLTQRAERAEAQVETLRTYIIYTPCSACGLPDPLRKGAACEQCTKAAEALASLPPQGERP